MDTMAQKAKNAIKQIRSKYDLFLLFAIPLIWYIIFKYLPIYGIQIAFRRFNPTLGVMGSQWVGLQYFKQFFDSYYFKDLILNTIMLSVYLLAIGFPIPILLALVINEIKSKPFQKWCRILHIFHTFCRLS